MMKVGAIQSTVATGPRLAHRRRWPAVTAIAANSPAELAKKRAIAIVSRLSRAELMISATTGFWSSAVSDGPSRAPAGWFRAAVWPDWAA